MPDTIRENLKEKYLESLIHQQDIKPIKSEGDLNLISSKWPVDDDPNDLLDFILKQRARRHERD